MRQRQRSTMIVDEVELVSPRAEMRDVSELSQVRRSRTGLRPAAGLRQPVAAYRIEIHSGKQCHIHSCHYQSGAEERNLSFTRTIIPGWDTLGDRSQQGQDSINAFRSNDSFT